MQFSSTKIKELSGKATLCSRLHKMSVFGSPPQTKLRELAVLACCCSLIIDQFHPGIQTLVHSAYAFDFLNIYGACIVARSLQTVNCLAHSRTFLLCLGLYRILSHAMCAAFYL